VRFEASIKWDFPINPNKVVSKFSKYPSFLGKKNIKKKNYKDLGIGQDLTKFEKILAPKSLNLYIYSKKKKYKGILRILIGFNGKSQLMNEVKKIWKINTLNWEFFTVREVIAKMKIIEES
jgi:hypothetical protein